jgi:hypothetical protein
MVSDIFIVDEGNSNVWKRQTTTEVYTLDWRGERQSLPRGSSPLMAFGGKCVDGQYFSAEEVERFVSNAELDRESVCVFEYMRPRL